MKVLDAITVLHRGEERRIELCHGDLAALEAADAVDILVVSAFPGDYRPAPGTLIRALADRGIDFASLAEAKDVDMRETFSCWLSAKIPGAPGFDRILCFEPLVRGEPPEVAGDIFQALSPVAGLSPQPISVAMPMVASGNQGVPAAAMLPPLVEAAVHWMQLELPLARLKIVERSGEKALRMSVQFAELKRRFNPPRPRDSLQKKLARVRAPVTCKEYDVFLSYAHTDSDKVDIVNAELHRLRPDLRVFLDRASLDTGAAWQQEIYESLDACAKVVAFFSPGYLASKMCKEEFNIALYRQRESEQEVLFPVYLFTGPLPTYMKMIQYCDCREGSEEALRAACADLAASLTEIGKPLVRPVRLEEV